MKEVLHTAHQWMEAYMKSFYCEDKDIMFGIQMKEKHTGYVTTNARQLALHLQLSSHDVDLAELIGLLHDVGRFLVKLLVGSLEERYMIVEISPSCEIKNPVP